MHRITIMVVFLGLLSLDFMVKAEDIGTFEYTYYSNGHIRSEETRNEDFGYFGEKFWDESGYLVRVTHFTHGLKTGTEEIYMHHGLVRIFIPYREGKKHGTATYYINTFKDPTAIIKFENDKAVEITCYPYQMADSFGVDLNIFDYEEELFIPSCLLWSKQNWDFNYDPNDS